MMKDGLHLRKKDDSFFVDKCIIEKKNGLVRTFDRPPVLWYDGITKETEVFIMREKSHTKH